MRWKYILLSNVSPNYPIQMQVISLLRPITLPDWIWYFTTFFQGINSDFTPIQEDIISKVSVKRVKYAKVSKLADDLIG